MDPRISKLTSFSFFIAICALSVQQLHAQTDPIDEYALLYGDEETVSIATGAEKPLRLAPSVATVITNDDIRATGARNLEEALQTVPGMHVSLGNRYSSVFSVRGVHTGFNPQILVLINGQPVTDLFSGGRLPQFNLPVNNIKRIEVVRGPVSALFGADAFSGAINIITYKAEETPHSVNVSAGSFDTQAASFQTSTTLGNWNVGFSLEWDKSDGDEDRRIEADLQTILDTLFSSNASLAPGSINTEYQMLNSQLQLNNKNWAITLNSWETKDTGIGLGVADALDPTGDQHSELLMLDVDYSITKNSWLIEANINYLDTEQRSYFTLLPAGAVLPIGADGNMDWVNPVGEVSFPDGYIGSPGSRDNTISGNFVATHTGIDAHRVRIATGYKRQKLETTETKNFGPGVIDGTQPIVDGTLTDVSGTPFVFAPDNSRDLYYLSLQDEWSFYRDWELTAGVRFDDYSDFGSTVNPRAALVWQTHYNLTTKLLYGSAFRAPSFSELSSVNNPVVIGNPGLDPEEVNTWELSFDFRPSYNLSTQLNLFKYRASDLIEFIPNSGGSNVAQNVLDLDGLGVELEANWKPSENFSLNSSYSLQKTENTNTGDEAADAPTQLLKVDLRWKLNRTMNFSAQMYHVAGRNRLVTDNRGDIDNYTLVNLNLYSDQWFPNIDFSVALKNIFDEDAFEPGAATVPLDHPLEGRSVAYTLLYHYN